MRHKNEIGKSYTRLTVIAYHNKDKYRNAVWLCKCSCGSTKLVSGHNLRNATIKSCGCLARESKNKPGYRHGASKSDECKIFYGIRYRCQTFTNSSYKYYGGRGIKCLWKSFEEFYRDMGNRPSKDHSIERINVNGDYCKANCVWIYKKEQNNNTRRNRRSSLNGKDLNLAQLTKKSKMSYSAIKYRIFKLGLPAEKAIVKSNLKEKLVKHKSTVLNFRQWSKKSGINYGTIIKRKALGWSVKDILDTPVNKKFSTYKPKR